MEKSVNHLQKKTADTESPAAITEPVRQNIKRPRLKIEKQTLLRTCSHENPEQDRSTDGVNNIPR